MTNNKTGLRDAILIVLDDDGGETHGTDSLASRLNAGKPWLIKSVRVLEKDGELTIIPSRGGRGHRTIYKRNPNSPGQPRRKTV